MLFERIYIFKYFYHKYKKSHHGLYVVRYSTLKHVCSNASDGGFKNIKWFLSHTDFVPLLTRVKEKENIIEV